MKFSIITPTYKRVDKLTRAVESVLSQTYTDWEMIIVNDSPEDTSYASFEKTVTDPRIVYLKNENNEGVNYCRNIALDNLSPDSSFVIFLDDDDWFNADALQNFVRTIEDRSDENWLVTNRALKSGDLLTSAPKNNSHYSYAWDYLILKRIKGDATHCIKTSALKNIKFSRSIKQGEEWFFFYQLGLKNKFYYSSHDSTISDGYNRVHGLNFRERTHKEKLLTLVKLVNDGFCMRLVYHPTFLTYLLMRLIRLIAKA